MGRLSPAPKGAQNFLAGNGGASPGAAHVEGMSRTALFQQDPAMLAWLVDEVESDEAAAVLWHFGGPGGRQPGQFVALLLRAMSHADPSNRSRLALGFPGLSRGFELATTEPFGLDLLAGAAEGGA